MIIIIVNGDILHDNIYADMKERILYDNNYADMKKGIL